MARSLLSSHSRLPPSDGSCRDRGLASSRLSITSYADNAFLEELGRRILTARNLRGLSRKALSQASGISQAYIGLLESGRGNISIVLLRRVSQATATPLADLIPSASPRRR